MSRNPDNAVTQQAFRIIDVALDALTSTQVEALVLAAAAQVCARRAAAVPPWGGLTAAHYRATAEALLDAERGDCFADRAAEIVKMF